LNAGFPGPVDFLTNKEAPASGLIQNSEMRGAPEDSQYRLSRSGTRVFSHCRKAVNNPELPMRSPPAARIVPGGSDDRRLQENFIGSL